MGLVGIAAQPTHAGFDFKVDVDLAGVGFEDGFEVFKGIQRANCAVKCSNLGKFYQFRGDSAEQGRGYEDAFTLGKGENLFSFFDGRNREAIGVLNGRADFGLRQGA